MGIRERSKFTGGGGLAQLGEAKILVHGNGGEGQNFRELSFFTGKGGAVCL